MFGGVFTKLSQLKRKGPSADVTPDAVNWIDIKKQCPGPVYGYTEARITGIAANITLSVTFGPSAAGTVTLYRKVSSVAGITIGGITYTGNNTFELEPPPGSPVQMTLTASGDTFTVQPNDYVMFSCEANAGVFNEAESTVTVTNVTDGNTILDTFLIGTINCN
jgi:hypothetical protein